MPSRLLLLLLLHQLPTTTKRPPGCQLTPNCCAGSTSSGLDSNAPPSKLLVTTFKTYSKRASRTYLTVECAVYDSGRAELKVNAYK